MNKKKLPFIVIPLVIILGAAFYFLYWIKTPEYSLNLARKAAANHDLTKFEQYVALEDIYNQAFNVFTKKNMDLMEKVTNSPKEIMGIDVRALAQSQAMSMQSSLVSDLVQKTKTYVETGNLPEDPKDLNMSDMKSWALQNDNMLTGYKNLKFEKIVSSKVDGNRAKVTVQVKDDKVGKDFNLEFTQRKLDNGQWQVIEISNLDSYIDEHWKAAEAKVEEINTEADKNISDVIKFGEVKGKIQTQTIYGIDFGKKLQVIQPVTLPDPKRKVQYFTGTYEIKHGDDLILTIPVFKPRNGKSIVADKYDQDDYTPDKVYEFYIQFDLNPFISGQSDIYQNGIDMYTITFKPGVIKLMDGTKYQRYSVLTWYAPQLLDM